MRLQHLIDIYWMEGNYVNDWMHISFYEGALDGTNPFSYRSCVNQPSHLPSRVVFVIYRTSMYIVNDNFESYQRYRGLDNWFWWHFFFLTSYTNVLLKVPNLDKFLHQVMQTLALFSGVVMIFVAGAPPILVPSSQIYFD